MTETALDPLRAAGLDEVSIREWMVSQPAAPGDLDGDRERYGQFWGRGDDLLRRLPPKPARSEAEAAAATAILATTRAQRERFLGAHADAVYDQLTADHTRFVRLDDLVYEAAAAFPGLTPTRERLAAESDLLQRDKDGLEIDQGIFLAHVLASERAGLHLCHTMLLPRAASAELVGKFATDGVIDL